MGQQTTFKHTFTYTAPEAKSVLVTGTFDNWSKTQVLENVSDGVFTATVQIPYEKPGEHILYKYVVDDNWLTDSKSETDTDEHGNVNNILYAPTEPEAAAETNVTEANVVDAEPEQQQPKEEEQQLPPLFVPPVVLPSDRAAYEAALAKGDNEVAQPPVSNIESFPVVENDLDRSHSPEQET
ncbi:Cruciform DNA binding protein [Umbelopsis nana]